MNNVTLMGRTTSDIELKTTTNGVSVATFTLAVDRKYTPKGQERQTDFINCVAWRNNAEFISKWFRKGDMIGVIGEIQTHSYTDKDGNKRTAVEVIIDNAYFCGGKKQQQTETAVDQQDYTTENNDDFDELPF